MKTLLSTFALTLGVFGIAQADMLTGVSVTDRYISGALDARIEELGTEKATGAKIPRWKMAAKGGVERHCTFTLVSRGVKDASACKR